MRPQEVTITKMETPKTIFDLSVAESAQLRNTAVYANVVEAAMSAKNASPRRGSHNFTRQQDT